MSYRLRLAGGPLAGAIIVLARAPLLGETIACAERPDGDADACYQVVRRSGGRVAGRYVGRRSSAIVARNSALLAGRR